MDKANSKFEKRKLWLIRTGIFFILILAIEIGLRISGQIPGVYNLDFVPLDSIVYTPYYYSDSIGIIHLTPLKTSPTYRRNSAGFRNQFEFDTATVQSARRKGKKIIFLIGDSYTEGCCPENYKNSFADLLRHKDDWLIMNFGVGGTDPLQYRLVMSHYIPQFQPDLVVVNFYMGNDLLYYFRTPKPGIPLSYPIKGLGHLPSEIPVHLAGEYNESYATPLEAYQGFMKHYTLLGPNRNFFERVLSKSVISTKIFIGAKLGYKNLRATYWHQTKAKGGLSFFFELSKMDSIAHYHNTSVIYSTIPSPDHVKEGKDLQARYAEYFEGIEFSSPNVKKFSLEDYDGPNDDNHFIESGHAKYAAFLEKEIEKALSGQ